LAGAIYLTVNRNMPRSRNNNVFSSHLTCLKLMSVCLR